MTDATTLAAATAERADFDAAVRDFIDRAATELAALAARDFDHNIGVRGVESYAAYELTKADVLAALANRIAVRADVGFQHYVADTMTARGE